MNGSAISRRSLARLLARSGFVAANEEAAELLRAAAGDGVLLRQMLERRLTGEPLPWVTGSTTFAGITLRVCPGVYVPRWQTGPLALAAAALLPTRGTGVDLCTGSGAVAAVMRRHRPQARVLATESDQAACACARANGFDIEVYEGDLDEPLPAELRGRVDVVAVVAPYVPSREIQFLPRDVRLYEPHAALDGGEDGLCVLRRAVDAAGRLLAPGGHFLTELGGAQDDMLATGLAGAGLEVVDRLVDDEGDLRGLVTRKAL